MVLLYTDLSNLTFPISLWSRNEGAHNGRNKTVDTAQQTTQHNKYI